MDIDNVRPSNEIFAMLGGFNISNLNDPKWTRRNISEIFPHPDFAKEKETRRFDADIAILTLSEKVEFSTRIRQICYPVEDQQIENVTGVVVGHGVNEQNKIEEIAKYINITAIKWERCIFMNTLYSAIISERTFCAGGRGLIACYGDSGGGFYVLEGNIWRIYGIVSAATTDQYGEFCNSALPTTFTNVAKFTSWIEDIVGS